jgi:hypothetical protein
VWKLLRRLSDIFFSRMHFSVDDVYHSVVAGNRRSVVRYLAVPPLQIVQQLTGRCHPLMRSGGLVPRIPGSKASVPIEYIGNQPSTGPDEDLQPSLLCGHGYNCLSVNPTKTHRRSGPGTLVQDFLKIIDV